VLGIAVILSFALMAAEARRRRFLYGYGLSPGRQGSSILATALEAAEAINAYNPNSLSDPRVHQGPVARLRPEHYQAGALDISSCFTSGSIVSIDLAMMDTREAARLVDFCSGLLLGSQGWLFRATDNVIILTPTRH
jgi:FtsZ-interacting cell division protein YlmF